MQISSIPHATFFTDHVGLWLVSFPLAIQAGLIQGLNNHVPLFMDEFQSEP